MSCTHLSSPGYEPRVRSGYRHGRPSVLREAEAAKRTRAWRTRTPAQGTGVTDFNQAKFNRLALQWARETRHVSSVTKLSLHPAYQQIIGMGPAAVPLILQRLMNSGGHWLWALNAITGEDPPPTDATFDEAVQAWLTWGRERGHLG
jgi:hypothetical protein